jgi:flagellar motility protein MotE (MotC chaperone)
LRSIRLLPIVIFAALALLVFKGIGLATNGGYVLTGPVAAIAEEGGGEVTSPSTPSDPTLMDANPSLADTAPTLATKVDAPPEGAPSGEHNASSSSAAEHASSSEEAAAASTCPDTQAPSSAPAGNATHDLNDKIGTALAKGCPPVSIPVNEHGDALPTVKDGTGKIVPLATAESDQSESALLQRLGDRRAELDKRESDLGMREALVAAAEKKLDERTKQLEDLETQVKALVDQKQAAEDANFKAIVSMYETMKPKDAAKIFDTLDLSVLIKVAQAMNPRKMSPVLAAMSPRPAEALTTAFAINNSPIPATTGGEDLAALPQIVGK